MSRLLVDTSAYSAWVRGHAALRAPVQRASALFLSVVTLGELRAGFRSGSRAVENEERLERFLASPRVEVLDVDADTSVPYAAIVAELRRRGTPVPANDIWIAASACQHGLRVLTLDRDFTRIPQVLVELVEPPSGA